MAVQAWRSWLTLDFGLPALSKRGKGNYNEPIMIRLLTARASFVCLVLGYSISVCVGDEPRDTGKWLVDLGRDYPLSAQASVTAADAELSLAFMQAAARIDPDFAEAYLWQYDLLRGLERFGEAAEALERSVALEPGDVAARLEAMAAKIEAWQTAEERADFCRETLEQGDLPAAVISDLHRRLSEHHLNRGELEAARREADLAIGAYAQNFAAHEIRWQTLGQEPGAVERVESLLTRLEVNPSDAGAAHRLGELLAALGLAESATVWFEHAVRLFREVYDQQAPVALTIAQAHALLDAGDVEAAQAEADRLLLDAPAVVDVYLLAMRIAHKRGNDSRAGQHLADASQLWRKVLAEAGGDLDPAITARIAWFYAHHDPAPEQAEKLARSVLVARPDVLPARRALGAALHQLGQSDEAQGELESIAEQDTWAALTLARILLEGQKAGEGVSILRRLMDEPLAPDERDALMGLVKDYRVDVAATRPAVSEVESRLAAFDREILRFPFEPTRFVRFSVKVSYPRLSPGEPWACLFRITNIGSINLHFGQEMMIRPDALCFITIRSESDRTPPAIALPMQRGLRLEPGGQISLEQTIDIGPLRNTLIATPQVEYEVSVAVVLSPGAAVVPSEDTLGPQGVRGVAVARAAFTRSAIRPTTEEVTRIGQRIQSPDPAERAIATEWLAMFLAEHHHVQAGKLRHPVKGISAGKVMQALLARSADESWVVRARLAEAMRWIVLDRDGTRVGAKLAGDKHWLVRGVALRMLADHYGGKVREILQRFADEDPDAWVRGVAEALLKRLERLEQEAASANEGS